MSRRGSVADTSPTPITVGNAITMTGGAINTANSQAQMTLAGALSGKLTIGGSGGMVDLRGTLTSNSEIDVVPFGTVVHVLSGFVNNGKIVSKGGKVL